MAGGRIAGRTARPETVRGGDGRRNEPPKPGPPPRTRPAAGLRCPRRPPAPKDEPPPVSRPLRSYDRVAGTYEFASHVFSGGKIAASKNAQLRHLNAGDKVLYLGVGGGEDAVPAAQKGCAVTCLDLSAGMIDRVRRKLAAKNLEAELIVGDAFAHDRAGHYDAVAANYFLNVFKPDGMRAMLRHAASLVKPDGFLFIADVSPPRGSAPARAFNRIYAKSAMVPFWLARLVPWHENYDYAKICGEEGLEVVEEVPFRFAKVGPVTFHTVVARVPGP